MVKLRRFKDRFIARVLTRFPGLVWWWAAGRNFQANNLRDPWADLRKPLVDCRVAIVTTAGVHLRDQTPFDMENPDGDPTFREIPGLPERDDLFITHDYYDHRDADEDINVVFPIDRLNDVAAEGRIAGPAPLHLGFMGHIDGPLVETLLHETAPAAARRLQEAEVDCVLLTPA